MSLKNISINLKNYLFIVLATMLVSSIIACGGGGGGSESDNTRNTPPITNAGIDVEALDLTTVKLDGSESTDIDGSIVSSQWTQVNNGAPQVLISSSNQLVATFVAPDVTSETLFEFELTNTDSDGDSSSDRVIVTVKNINCADEISIVTDHGFIVTPATGDFEPSCSGDLYISNQYLNTVELRNIATGGIKKSYQLTATPTDLEYDKMTGKLYVALSGATFFAIIDTHAETVKYVQTADIVYFISAGKNGDIYLSVGSDYRKDLYKVDSSGSIFGPWKIDGGVIRYNSSNDQILTATYGLSPSTFLRYGFDSSGQLIKYDEIYSGGNGQALALSSEGTRAAFAVGGGNGDGYTIYDFDAADLSVTYGEWDTGPYPSGAAFSPDSSMFAASNYNGLMVFDAVTHAEKMTAIIPKCDYGEFEEVGFSRGGKLVFIKQTCGFNRDVSELHFYKIPGT